MLITHSDFDLNRCTLYLGTRRNQVETLCVIKVLHLSQDLCQIFTTTCNGRQVIPIPNSMSYSLTKSTEFPGVLLQSTSSLHV